MAYVPERITPGKILKEFVESPRLVGGIGPKSTKAAAELFKIVCKDVLETDALTAEITKLVENTFRDLNIAFANELALLCEKYGVDVMEVIKLANTHPRVNVHMPGPGVGGPCLTKDPCLLIHGLDFLEFDIIKDARKINDYMSKHKVKLILKALDVAGKSSKGSKIAILGTAYKAGVGDSRSSPSEPIIRYLKELGANIITYDPYCKEGFGSDKADSLEEAVKGADIVVIITDHREFKNMDLNQIKALMGTAPIILDAKRVLDPAEAKRLGFIYCGIGYGKTC